MKILSEDKVKEIIAKSFLAGQMWGETYKGWFEPTFKDSAEKLEKIMNDIMKEIE